MQKRVKLTYQYDHISLVHANHPQQQLILTFYPYSIKQAPKKDRLSYDLEFDEFLGVKYVKQIPYILVVVESYPAASIHLSTVYQIRQVRWIPIVPESKRQQYAEESQQQFKEINKLFQSGHHYFSTDYSLHQSFVVNVFGCNKEKEKFYEQFIWNQGLRTLNSENPKLAAWCTPIIQGFVQSFSAEVSKTNLIIIFVLISRRSHKKTGTRYYSRGIDEKGNVANFTQTEQILIYNNYAFSHLQIRGSVPAFFQQVGITGIAGQLSITRNESTTKRAYEQHFNKLVDMYGDVMCVNLLSKKKSEQSKLINFYESLLNKNPHPKIHYTFFDFHEECKNNKFENASKLVEELNNFINTYGYSVISLIDSKLVNEQNGILRVNCLDCLDRTNYVESRVGFQILEKQIKSFGGPQFSHFQEQGITDKFLLEINFPDIIQPFNETWADNGDAISYQYTGIGSTHTDITKKGKRTLSGSLNHKYRSVMRFFNQFSDHKKHEVINDLVSGPGLKSTIKFKKPENQFMDALLMSYYIPNKEQASSEINLDYTFTQQEIKKRNPPLLIIYGYMKNSSSWFKMFSKQKYTELQYFIQSKTFHARTLGYDNFAKVVTQYSCLLLFATMEAAENLHDIHHQTINYNPDEILVSKFTLYQTALVFSGANCSNFKSFKKLSNKSHEQAFQGTKLGKSKTSKISDHQYRILFGNTGSTIQTVSSEQEKIKAIHKALQNDELEKERLDKSSVLANYLQGPFDFIPQNNRILFWNQDDYLVKIREYGQRKSERCIFSSFSFEIFKEKE